MIPTVKLYNADCLDILPTLESGSVDAIVTSPPYNTLPATHNPSGLHAERQSGVNKWIQKASTGYFDQRPEGDYQAWICNVIGECLRVSRGLVWVNHKVRYRDGKAIHPARMFPWPIYSEVIWDRGVSMALNCRRFAPSHECLLAFGTSTHWDDEQNTRMSVWRINPQNSEDHPCPFPVEIPRRLILASCPEGGTVLDPFAGWASTAIAAMRTGRNFIGCEIDPEFYRKAECRIEAERTRHPLFAGIESLELGSK